MATISTKKLKQNGFTLIEALLALLITLIISLCMVVFLRTCLLYLQFRPSHQDQMAIIQLRQIAAISSDIRVEDEKLYMIYNHEEINVGFDKRRLVRKDGYEILMENLDDAYFIEDDEKFYLIYTRSDKRYKVQII